MMKKLILGPAKFAGKIVGKVCDDTANKIAALTGFLGFSQGPAYMSHYTQRLGGGVDELENVVNGYEGVATSAGMTLSEYITELTSYASENLCALGEVIQNHVFRYEDLKNSLEAITNADIFTKPVVFMQNIDWDMARSALENYTPSVNIGAEGLAYAAAGFFLLPFIYKCGKESVKYVGGKLFSGKKVVEPVSA